MSLLLSLCIPTYNHASHLEQLLASIPDSCVDKIEICISNNACTDNTEEVVLLNSKRFPHLRYTKKHSHVSFDENLQSTVSIAHGEYCWTFGSDDRFLPDAFDKIFDILERNKPGILIAPAILRDVQGRWERKSPYLPESVPQYAFRFRETNRMTTYFDLAQSLPAVGAFISSNIFKRRLWEDAKIDINLAFGYGHLSKIVAMLTEPANSNESFELISEYLILATANNDETSRGMWSSKHRMFLDYKAVVALADRYFHDKALSNAYKGILRRQHPFWWLYRSLIVPECNEEELALLKSIYPRWWIGFMRFFCYRRDGLVHRSLKTARDIYQQTFC